MENMYGHLSANGVGEWNNLSWFTYTDMSCYSAVRAVTRSKGCLEWDSEMKEHKAFPRSNFISHIEQHCRKIPADKKRFVAPDSEDDAAQHPTSALGLTRQEFNGALAKAVVQDNHAMTLGEGDGMAEFFQLILPGVRLPSHQTLRRHLDRLYEGLNKQIKLSLKVCL